MFKTVILYLDDNSSAWNGTALFVTAVQQFKDKIAAIDKAAQRQETPRSGATADKASARKALEGLLFYTCEALAVIGSITKDNDLIALSAMAVSTLQRLGDEELANRATIVLQKTNTKVADLAALQVTQANIDELSQALHAFKATKEMPRTVTAGRAAETEALASLIRDGSDMLRHQIDRLVNLVRRSNEKFVTGYRSARVVVDRPATHAPPKRPVTPQVPNPS